MAANDRQVGGDHYIVAVGKCPSCGGHIQHWDLYADMPYLVGQVTKYAIDINLFDKTGKYLMKTEDHLITGTFWKGLHELARWGGDFKPKPDGNHYSLEWQGRK